MKNYNSKLKIIFLFSVFCFLFSVLVSEANAADAFLYLSPSTGNYTVGNTFLIQAKVNSGGVPTNAADGTLVFNPDKLEIKSISKTESVFSLWVQEPTFSNSLGTINFAGGKPSPGFIGAAGIIFTITFKAKTATIDPASVTFAAGSVLADDGKGTNILTNMGSGSYKLVARAITPVLPEEEEYVPSITPSQTPAAPIVSSPTHPDENSWYSNNDPEFIWKLPADVTGVSLLLNQKPTSNPGPNSDGMMESKKYEDVEDGIWYFHIKFENEYGWGTITHRKVLIDTQTPAPFEITVDNENDPTNPTPIFLFQSEDSVSGINYYEVKVVGQKATTSASTRENSYRPLPVPPGKQTVEVKAFDRTGNFTSASADFEILPLSTPEITKISKDIRIGEVLEIEGRTLPELSVIIYIQKSKEEPILVKVKPDHQGDFSLSYEKALTEGSYTIWARAQDERGALSYPTKTYPLKVGLPPFLKFGKIALDYLTTMITLIILVVGLIAVIFYAWYRIEIWRKRVRKETKEATQSITAAFRALSQEVEEQVEKLDRKPGLSKAERDLRDKLQEALEMSERFITKEMEDIDKELE
jgi:hypothetical protein